MSDFKLTLTTVDDCTKRIKALFITDPASKFRVKIIKWSSKRGISMNRQQHLFYNQISKWYGDRTPLTVKTECKAIFGIPILLNSEIHGDNLEFILHELNYYNKNYEDKLRLVQCLSVTSEFNTAESKEYTDQMIYFFNDIGVPLQYQDK